MSDPSNGSAIPATHRNRAPHAADVQDAGARAQDGTGPQLPDPVGLGARLSTARAAHGLSLGDVARQLKLSVRQVEALERDDYDVFASQVFVRGFLRNYAKLLRIDLDSQIAQLGADEAEASPSPEADAAQAAHARAARRTRRLRWILGAVAAALIALALLRPAFDRNAGPHGTGAVPSEAPRLSEPPPMPDATGAVRAEPE